MCMYACLSECVLCGYRCLWRLERGLEFPGAGARAGDIHTIMSPWLMWQPGNELVLRKSSLYCWSIFLLSPNSFSLKGLKSQKHIFFLTPWKIVPELQRERKETMKSFWVNLFSWGRAGSFSTWAANFTSRVWVGGTCSYFLTSCAILKL